VLSEYQNQKLTTGQTWSLNREDNKQNFDEETILQAAIWKIEIDLREIDCRDGR
jgi:hypothetical protein